MKIWLNKIYDFFRRKPVSVPTSIPVVKSYPPFEQTKARSPFIYRAFGVVYGFELIVHKFEAKRFSQNLLYSMPSSGKRLVERLLESETQEADRKLLRFLTCYSETDISINPTHFLSISYEFMRDGSRVILLQMPLNFRVPGFDSDFVCRKCCEFAASIIVQNQLRKNEVKIDKPNEMLIAHGSRTKIFWLTMLFVRYRWFYQEQSET